MPKPKSRIFVVIPCFNEHTIIKEVVLQLLDGGYEILVVDDGSQPSLKEYIHDLPIHYLRHWINLGQGAALQTGTTYALKKDADIIVHFDGDGQHRPEDIAKLIQPILDSEVDIVLGSRFMKPEHRAYIPTNRRVLLQIARIFNGLLTGIWLSDAHNGFRAMNRKAALSMTITENRMAHASEILQLIQREQLTWKEVPTQINYTPYSQNKGQSSWNMINILIDLLIKRWI